MIDCKNYVITHVRFPVHEDDMYKVLCVGGLRSDNHLMEADGDNIMQYNRRINECTGLYWIWKNTSSEYIGMSHYRRWFYNDRFPHDDSRLDAERVETLMADHDIILTGRRWFNWRVIDNMRIALGEELTEQANIVFQQMIEKHHPDYIDAYNRVMQGDNMHICNLFVTRRPIMNEYCEWLFSFLLDAADGIDVTGLTIKQQRVAGYFAEAMWTVWLQNQNLRICKQPHRMVGG